MNANSQNIAAALFMVIGALIGAMIMALLIPERGRGLLELKAGLAIGAFIGYSCFRITAYFIDKSGESGNYSKDE